MYLRPPSASEEARINDWIKVRQSGIRYYLSLGDQRIVDKNYIIRPKAEFEVRFPLNYIESTINSFSNQCPILRTQCSIFKRNLCNNQLKNFANSIFGGNFLALDSLKF